MEESDGRCWWRRRAISHTLRLFPPPGHSKRHPMRKQCGDGRRHSKARSSPVMTTPRVRPWMHPNQWVGVYSPDKTGPASVRLVTCSHEEMRTLNSGRRSQDRELSQIPGPPYNVANTLWPNIQSTDEICTIVLGESTIDSRVQSIGRDQQAGYGPKENRSINRSIFHKEPPFQESHPKRLFQFRRR